MSAFSRNLILFDVLLWLMVFFVLRQFASVPGHPLFPVIFANITVAFVNMLGTFFWTFRR